MGILFKSTCYCKGGNRRTHCKTSYRRQETERRLSQWRHELEEYTGSPGCVPGMSEEHKPNEELMTLMAAFRSIVSRFQKVDTQNARSLSNSLDDVLVAVHIVRGIADLVEDAFAGMGKSTHKLIAARSDETPDNLQGEAAEYDELAQLLGKAFDKGLAEINAAVDSNNVASILHHSAVLTEQTYGLLELISLAYPECLPAGGDIVAIAALDVLDLSDLKVDTYVLKVSLEKDLRKTIEALEELVRKGVEPPNSSKLSDAKLKLVQLRERMITELKELTAEERKKVKERIGGKSDDGKEKDKDKEKGKGKEAKKGKKKSKGK